MGEPDTSSGQLRDARMGRILSDLHDRRARGEDVHEQDLLAAHPEFAGELREHLHTLAELRPVDHTIEGLIRRGWLFPSTDAKYAAEFGSYKIIEPLGRGGMGIVLKAYDESLRRVVAIKLLRPDVADDETVLARFTREARAAAALAHSNIVGVFAVGQEHGAHYIAMEYIEGLSLAQLIHERGPLPTEMIRSLFAQLLEGLSAAHAAGLIHRDIKSANLLLSGSQPPSAVRTEAQPGTSILNPQVSRLLKIADFGLARITSSQTRLTLPEQSFGTPEYMSPEQALGEENVDARTDLYSAGVVLYEMLTGRVPFKADSPTAVVHQILHSAPADPRSIIPQADPALSSLALRLIAKRRKDRLETAAEVIASLEAQTRVSLPHKRRAFRRLAAIIAVVFVVLASMVWMVIIRFGPRPISAVWVNKENRRQVLARRGDDAIPQVLEVFEGELPEGARVTSAAVAKCASGESAIVCGLNPPLRGECLFASDESGKRLWSLDLSDGKQWPDCDPATGWGCDCVLVGNVDDKEGDELIVVASDLFQYPSRISIIDPLTAQIRATFWHFGDIVCAIDDVSQIWLDQDFFGPQKPALIAHGFNNKLDGFNELTLQGESSLTSWDIVPVVMILDPRELLLDDTGLGPPRTSRLEYPAAKVYAYAFLNLSQSDQPIYGTKGSRPIHEPKREDMGRIEYIRPSSERVSDATGPWLQIGVSSLWRTKAGGILTVDRALNIRKVNLFPHTPIEGMEAYWREKWRIIIQDNNYLSVKE